MSLLTCCPHCHAVYRLRPAQLSAARGFVECGDCAQVFNALDRLAEDVRPQVAMTARAAPPDASTVSQDDLAALAIDADDDGPRVDAAALEDLLVGDAAPALPRIELAQAEPPLVAQRPVRSVEAVPAVLRDDLARLAARERRGPGFAWGLAAALLLATLAAQSAWHWRGDLLARFPQLMPLGTQVCARLGCRLERPASIADIELVARDVREHPQYVDALLVNATLLNRGHGAATYPVIQLGVFDRRGGMVGVRRFAPRDYLDASIDIEAGMPAGRRVHLVLEIAAVGKRADSFEFDFL
jgi:predicted Zn finger-like uncharacterized protein